ncbi:phytanoyl-CoA dioxygenase family protein [Pseudoalteromonas ardens]|uniref:Phytanoyl-CoA dioxygenase n=1 Tax=Pseudoalteromonas rubra TaxID=43658 RepID=A0A0L0ETH6_9GAMM|nr:phytanoyl-CoA dioxygenase family protein [Pseudoalteromonas sp. R96]KNC67675.1 phytanoyl-CoA dioxygenase [Pseudoalteromonas rubra]MDK1309832.1 phytanoyl-CoA dioxygenase family protein [Pseudoalteromonas sp. R96]
MVSIGKEKLSFYEQNGFVRFEQALSQDLLARLRDLSVRLEDSAKADLANGALRNQYFLSTESEEPKLFRYNDLLFDDPELVLALLASPTMMAICEQMVGLGCVPMQLDLVYKYPHPHPHIAWHHGAPHPRNYPYLNVGVYLDDADLDDGCLRYVPDTQHEVLDIYELSSQYGWDIPGVVQQPAKAGDILVQDMMILHSSEPKRSEGPRRTIYIELRPVEGIAESAMQTAQWAELRKQWMAHVIKAADPQDVPVGWLEYYGEPEHDLPTLVTMIEEKRESPIPAVWSHRNVEHPDYPTPADLR